MKKSIGLLFAATLLLSACGAQKAIDNTNKIPKKLDDTIKTMEKTECTLVRGLSFENLLKDEFARDLTPVPFDLMPFAREFGKCSSDEDLAEVTYMWMKKLNEVTLDLPSPTEAQVAEFNHRKLHVYSALQAVAGCLGGLVRS